MSILLQAADAGDVLLLQSQVGLAIFIRLKKTGLLE
jgi:hypothetical protein